MIPVVSCFIKKGDKILILRRSRKVRTYKCKWATVSGYLGADEKPDERALKEVYEETKLYQENLKPIGKGEPFAIRNKEGDWMVYPYLFELRSGEPRLDWEHEEYRWIRVGELKKYSTVPKLREALERVLNK